MERYHIFKLGLAILFYAAYCIRPMLVNGLRYNDLAQNNNRPKQVLRPEDYDVYYQGVDGVPGVDFPVLSYIPRTTFSCREIESGYYADLDTDCQVFHICEEGKKISFLCPNGTVFDQSDLICEWWYKVNCTNSPNLYEESAERLRGDLAKRKASRRVSLDGHERNHGAIMRIEESSSVSAKQNGRPLEVSPSIKNIVTTNRVSGHNIAGDTSHSNRNSNIPPKSAINTINGDQNIPQKPKRYNDAQTGNFVNNLNQANGNQRSNKNLKEYHLQFSGTSPALDAASSKKFQHVYTRSTTPSSMNNHFPSEAEETAHKKQSNGNRGSIKYNNFGETENRQSSSTLKPSKEYDLDFPKHKSQIAKENTPRASSASVKVNKVDADNIAGTKQKGTGALTKNGFTTRQLEPTGSDELQIPQETAAFVTNSHNSIQATTRKQSTLNFYPNHRSTYSDLKQPQPNFSTTKFLNGIKSVTPQYITTQSINDGKPFIGSTVGINIYNSNTGRTTPNPEASTRIPISSSSQRSSFPVTIQPAVFISSISPFEEGNTKLAQIFASTFQPSVSSTVVQHFEGTTKKIVDHATVYGTFSKSAATTPLPLSDAEVKFANGVNKIGIHLTKAVVGSTVTPLPPTNANFGQSTLQTIGSDFVSITVSRTSPNINKKFEEFKNSHVTSVGGTTFKPKYSQSTTIAPKSGTGSIKSGDYVTGTETSSIKVDFSQNGIGSTLVPDNFQSTISSLPESIGVGSSFNSATVRDGKNLGLFKSPANDQVTKTFEPFIKQNISGVEHLTDSPKYDISILPSLLPTITFNQSKDTQSTSSPVLVEVGKNYASTLRPLLATVDSTSSSLLPNTLTLQEGLTAESSNTGPLTGENTPVTKSPVVVSTNAGSNFQGSTRSNGEILFNSVTSADKGPTSSNSHGAPKKTESHSNEGQLQYSSTDTLPRNDLAHTMTLGTFSNSIGDNAKSKLIIKSSTIPPTRATYLPKVNSTSRGATTEGIPKYSPSIILPPHLPAHSFANVNNLDGTGAFFSNENSVPTFNSYRPINGTSVSHNIISSTLKPDTVSTSNNIQSAFRNIEHSNNFRTNQGFLTTANPIGEGSSGFYVTKNSVYDPSTATPLSFSTTPNYNEATPIVNVSPNSGERDIQSPQMTLSTPKFESSVVLSKSETTWPRPFQRSPNSLDQQNEPVTPSYLNYQISSARPFKLPEEQATPAPTLPTPFTTAPTKASSMYENVDNMINVLKEIVNAKEEDYSSETPRPGLIIPPSAGPQTLHTLAVYFANALDGIAAERERLTGEELDDESKEKLTGLLTQMTMYRYNELFKGKEVDKDADATTTVATDDILQGEDSTNPIETPALRQLARNFSLALSSYLDDPEAFRRDLENLRPTEPPALSEDATEASVGEEELLNFSDADSQSSFPPVFPTSSSVSPTWGYIIASKSQGDLDLSNSLNPDLNTADTQSFVPRYNNLAVNDKGFGKESVKGNLDNKKDFPEDHWTTSPGVTKLWQSTLLIDPADLNEHFETTESMPRTTESDLSAPGTLPSLNIPQTEIQYDLRALPQLSLNSTQVHGILIDFMNTTKTNESNRLQRLLKKLNTTEVEFLDKMKEIESNPLTKRLILLLISECGANATEDLAEHSIHNLSEEILKPSHSRSAVAAETEDKRLVNSDIPALVDPNLQEEDQDTRALQLLNSLYTIASKFGK